LLDLAIHLSLMIKTNDEKLKAVHFDSIDFPCAFISNDAKTALKAIFGGLSNTHIASFLKSAMIQLLDDHDKGVHSIGLRLLIQICARLKQTVFITNRKNFFDLLNAYREHTVKFKLLIWVIRQACSNYNTACQIWLIYFLPFITQKCHTEFVIGFGEEMRQYPIDSTGNDTSLLVTDFVPIIDLIFTADSIQQEDRKFNKKRQAKFQLNTNQIDRLKTIYPKIKEQAFLSKSPGTLKDYFASLFLRLSPQNRNGVLNKELLDCLDHCVKVSPESINQLGHLHKDYPQQTKIFLDHLNNDNSSSAQQIKKMKSFKALLTKIHSATLAAPAGSVHDNLHQLSKTCQPRKSSSCLGLLIRMFIYISLLGVLAGGIMYCQYPQQLREVQKRFQPHLDIVMHHMTPAYKFCENHAIHGYELAKPVVLDVLEKVQNKSSEFWVAMKPYLSDVVIKIDYLFKLFQSKMDEVFPKALEQMGQMYEAVYNYVSKTTNDVVSYFQSPEFEALVKAFSERLNTVAMQIQEGYRYAMNYAMKMMGN